MHTAPPIQRQTVTAGQSETVLNVASELEPVHIEVTVEEGSEMHYVFVSHGTSAELRASIHADAKMHWYIFTIGGDNSSFDLRSELVGPNARSEVDWFFRTQQKEHQKIDARNIFNAPNGGGEMIIRGIAEDHSHVEANGMIDIGLEGGGTETYLTEEVLMLDSTAKVDAVPGLEIKTNDVEASHSATVSRVTPEQLFYLQSRGLPEHVARKLFIDGFVQQMVQRVPENVRKKLSSELQRD